MTYQIRGLIKCVMCNERPAETRKLCHRCYYRAQRAGTLPKYPIHGPEDVFELRINKTKSCWLWTGTKNGYGYGIFIMPGEIHVRAHRYSYEYFGGKIPKGKLVLHKCDNPACVNPKHLRLGTYLDNNRDAKRKGRNARGSRNGHAKLSERNVRSIMASNERQTVLARHYGVHQSVISTIKSGKRWKHVTTPETHRR